MTPPRVSIVIVSRGRPDALQLCLTGISQLVYPDFEVVVVADSTSMAGVQNRDQIKTVAFEEANISAARNAGIAVAAGDLVAFIDDDAVPEPTWLTYLAAPFAQTDVAAAGGFVLGRNGISYQWRARMAFPDGGAAPFDVPEDEVTILAGETGRAVKTEGTNMAVRKSILDDLGGFDAAFAFYLDETDLNMRIAARGLKTAVVPRAVVHHGFAASQRRTQARVPRDLTEIGASIAVFQRKHSNVASPFRPRQQQRDRLLRHMIAGDMMPGDVNRLLRGFDQGWLDGMERPLEQYTKPATPPAFLPYPSRTNAAQHDIITGRFWQAGKTRAAARTAVAAGHIVSVYLLSLTALYHRCTFQPGGYWLQRGGQFGKSDRSDPIFKFWSAKGRVLREHDRVKSVRVPDVPQV